MERWCFGKLTAGPVWGWIGEGRNSRQADLREVIAIIQQKMMKTCPKTVGKERKKKLQEKSSR